jgi:hypothetical protein
MRGLSQGVELLRLEKDSDDSEWYVAQLAIHGTLATTFSVPTPVVWEYLEAYDGEAQLMSYLERQAINLIERYGDARSPRPDPVLLEAS